MRSRLREWLFAAFALLLVTNARANSSLHLPQVFFNHVEIDVSATTYQAMVLSVRR